MTPIEMLLTYFILSNPACYAHPARITSLGRQDYQVLSWSCLDHDWQAWQRSCEGKFWSHTFYLQETRSQIAIFLDRFGAVRVETGAQLEEMFVPSCGS